MSTQQPIFIVGVPRSGTTLLTAILSRHPAIAISPESHFFNFWLAKYGDLPISDFWEILISSQRFGYFGLPPAQVLTYLKNREELLSHRSIFAAILTSYAARLDKPRWGEKTPMHYQHLDQIFNWYPNAQVLWLIRDPRATVASLLRVDWASPYTYKNAMLWEQNAKLFQQHWLKDNRVKQIHYEHLVTMPETCMKEICSFLGEIYNPEIIYDRNATSMPIFNRKGWAKSHLQQSLQPINVKALTKWKQRLSSSQISLIEYLCQPLMNTYGYLPETNSLSIFARLLWQQERLRVRWQNLIRNRLPRSKTSKLAEQIHGITFLDSPISLD